MVKVLWNKLHYCCCYKHKKSDNTSWTDSMFDMGLCLLILSEYTHKIGQEFLTASMFDTWGSFLFYIASILIELDKTSWTDSMFDTWGCVYSYIACILIKLDKNSWTASLFDMGLCILLHSLYTDKIGQDFLDSIIKTAPGGKVLRKRKNKNNKIGQDLLDSQYVWHMGLPGYRSDAWAPEQSHHRFTL